MIFDSSGWATVASSTSTDAPGYIAVTSTWGAPRRTDRYRDRHHAGRPCRGSPARATERPGDTRARSARRQAELKPMISAVFIDIGELRDRNPRERQGCDPSGDAEEIVPGHYAGSNVLGFADSSVPSDLSPHF